MITREPHPGAGSMGITNEEFSERYDHHIGRVAGTKMKEVELAALIVEWLRSQHYVVYQEVIFGGPIADIVVDVNGRGWVIETKISLGLAVIGQAYQWQGKGATRVSVGVPHTRRDSSSSRMAYRICRDYGIGIINAGRGNVQEYDKPAFVRNRRWAKDILSVCKPEHMNTAKAGSQGGYWTPYKDTIEQVRSFLQGKGWVKFKDIIDNTKHHYASTSTARSCLSRNLQTIEKASFECRHEGRNLEFRIKP